MLKDFTLDDLKNGLVCRLRNNEVYMVINDILVDMNHYRLITDYNNNLTFYDDNHTEYDIMEVYNVLYNTSLKYILQLDGCVLIWKRTELTVTNPEELSKLHTTLHNILNETVDDTGDETLEELYDTIGNLMLRLEKLNFTEKRNK